MSMMVKDHKKDVAEFQKESKSGKDADVKSLGPATLPTLRGPSEDGRGHQLGAHKKKSGEHQ